MQALDALKLPGYYAFLVAQLVAANPRSINSLPPANAPGKDPIGEIKRKDGTTHTLNLRHYLDLFRGDHGLQQEVLRAWAMGAPLRVSYRQLILLIYQPPLLRRPSVELI
jgi:hypothetical protein